MENWNNLNLILDIERKDAKQLELFAKEMIDLCTKGNKEEIKKLLKKGAPLNCHEEHITPLIVCIQNDDYALASYLIKSGASVSYRPTLEFEDALWYALKNKKHTFLKLFIEKKCILQREYNTSLTPLIYATIESDLKSVEYLLNHYNIKVNERDKLGNTALHHNLSKTEMTQDDIDIGKLLLAAGADTNITNLEGKTPEDLGQDYAAKAIVLSEKLEQELDVKENSELSEQLEKELETKQENNGVFTTPGKRMKI